MSLLKYSDHTSKLSLVWNEGISLDFKRSVLEMRETRSLDLLGSMGVVVTRMSLLFRSAFSVVRMLIWFLHVVMSMMFC